jgi:hypothetical protein
MTKFSSRALLPILATFALATGGVLASAGAASAAPPPLRIYVSPTAGPIGIGTLAHPLKTLEQARDAVRLVNLLAPRDIDVELLGGTYTLSSTLTLTSRDSGRNGHTVTWEAAPGAHPVVSGGKIVSGWTLADLTRGIYKAHVGSLDTRELYVDGENEPRARGAVDPGGFTKTATGYTTTDASLASLTNQSAIEVASRWGWMLYRCPVQSIVGSTVTMQQPCWDNANLHAGQEIQTPTWIENAKEYLDAPGEWYLDRAAGDLYYLPKPGQNLSTAQVVIPKLQDLVDLNGAAGNPVTNVAFSGITFSHSSWLAPSSPDGLVEGQAGFRITGSDNPTFDSTRAKWVKTPGAVNLNYTQHVAFTRDTFTHLGAVGLNLNTGSQGTTIVGNAFTDIAATGIQIGGTDVIDHHPTDARSTTADTLVRDNVVRNVADIYTGSVGILAGYTARTTIEHNRVYDLPYSGISVGWGWGLTDQGGDTNYPGNLGVPVYSTPTTSRDTVIRDNEISDIMKLQADGGAIYTLGSSPDSTITGNYVHDIPAPAYGAIYHDEGSRYFHDTDNGFCSVAYQWLIMNHGLNITSDRNFTTQPAFTTQANTIDSTVANNPTVAGCSQLPASIVRNAGLEPAYRNLDPRPAPTDGTAPTTPGMPVAIASFPSIADLDWAESADATGVTGYSVFANGELVGASQGASARITGLTPGATYSLRVSARDAAGNSSAQGASTSITMPPDNDLALGKDVTASSTFSTDYAPGLVVDGSLSTRWAQASHAPDPSWVQIDLGANYTLGGVITTFERSSGYAYRVETSLDGTAWSTLDDHSASLTTEATNYSSGSIIGRYLRVTITGSSGNGGSVYEVQAYGSPVTGAGDTQSPTAPTNLTAAPQLPTVAQLNWSPATDNVGVGSYLVYRDGIQIGSTTARSFTATGLTAGQTYSFAVVAQDAAANHSTSSAAALVTMPADDDLLLGGTATASSEFSVDYSAGKAIDGDPSTRWAQGPGIPDPSWLSVDMGSIKTVRAVVTRFEKTSGYAYRIETSTDGATWSTFDDHTGNAIASSPAYSLSATPVSARYVRLTITGSNFNGGSVFEFQAYGGF